MKIRVRLGIGFAFVAMLLVSISTVSFLRLSVINADISDRLNDKFPKTVWANDVINNVIARALRNSLLVKDEDVAKELNRVTEAREAIAQRLSQASSEQADSEKETSFVRF